MMEMKDIRSALNDPDIAKATKFDAIRYDDEGRTSWAFPDISKVETPWGTKIGSKSMGDYPFRLSTMSGGSEYEQIGHFATKKEALKHAAEKFPEEYPKLRVFLGSDKVADVKKANLIDEEINLNPGLKGYLNQDKKIQKQVAASVTKKYPDADNYKFLQEGYASNMYKTKYNNLNEWQKWDVDAKIKNDQLSVGIGSTDDITKSTISQQTAQNKLAVDHYGLQYDELSGSAKQAVDDTLATKAGNKVYGLGDDYDYDFEATDAPYHDVEYGGSYSKPKVSESLKDKIKFKIAKSDYGDDYYNLSKDSKKNVDEIYDIVTSGKDAEDIEWIKKQHPEMWQELDAVYGTGSKPLSGTGWKHYSGPGSEVKESIGSVFDIAKQKYNKPFDELTDTQKMKVWDDLKSASSPGGKLKAAADKLKTGSASNPDYDKLTPNQKKILEDFEKVNKSSSIKDQDWITAIKNKSTAQDDDAVVVLASDEAYGVKTFNVTKGDLKKFAKKGAALDPIAEHYYGKKYEDLSPGEADFVWDISTDALKYGDKE
jgi:hypothetical protein